MRHGSQIACASIWIPSREDSRMRHENHSAQRLRVRGAKRHPDCIGRRCLATDTETGASDIAVTQASCWHSRQRLVTVRAGPLRFMPASSRSRRERIDGRDQMPAAKSAMRRLKYPSRRLLEASLSCLFLVFCASTLPASPGPQLPQQYLLRLHHTHTGEQIDIVYRRGTLISQPH